MDIAILILLIVTLILLGIVTFFIFQIWIQSKESKIHLTNHLQEIQKGFSQMDHNLKIQNNQVIDNIRVDQKNLANSLEAIKENLKEVNTEIIKIINDISQIDSRIQNSERRMIDSLDSLKVKTSTSVEELSDNVRIFKVNIESRIKEFDLSISERLVSNLTDITREYSENIKEQQEEVLEFFERTARDIDKNQANILHAITEPLKINFLDRND